ncbi:PAS domain S-box-containing protein/diguanylate cyclase (GGDEF)-like protein [Leucobacter luti]|uniref:PAS domain S-box-containing protein/diguanylate cyclase (GGDEF)-like protein n=1 Tax=Leucobacter luti TaxID=340320 RepID=A0A4R6S2J2_9MICO|nr:sensor domain-containing diguanylate cyclase [Leucobacter luti]TDP93493.1 PAS domain S-box-containing protein/diguanylate cyclase (GGDEF)-like protein [Leucobacter luti]
MIAGHAAAEHVRLLEHSPAALLAVDLNGAILAHNRALRTWLRISEDAPDLGGRNLIEWLTPSARLLYETRIMPQLFATGHAREVVLDLRDAAGVERPVLCNAELHRDAAGSHSVYIAALDVSGRISFERDLVTARRAADEAHERLALLQEATSALAVARGISDLAEALVVGASRATHAAWTAVRIVAEPKSEDQVAAHLGGSIPLRDRATTHSERRIETWGELPAGWALGGGFASRATQVVCRTPAEIRSALPEMAAELGANGVEAVLLTPIVRGPGVDDQVLGEIICGFRRSRALEADDLEIVHALGLQAERVIEHLQLQEQLRHRALHDGLTGLPNRVLFAERLSQLLATAARTGEACAVLFIDLDGFKAINDGAGHSVGDEVLRLVAARIRSSCRAGDTVSRLGGDEFVVAVSNASRDAVTALAERIRAAVGAPIDDVADGASLSTSVGVVRWDPADHVGHPTADGIMNAADAAMYAAKYGGKNAVVVREWGE